MKQPDNPLKKLAQIAGAFYLIEITAGIFTETFVRGKMIAGGNAAATANNILASETLWRIGFTCDIIMIVCDVFVTLILYSLLKPINKNISLIAATFSLVTDAIQGISLIFHFAPLFILSGHSNYLQVFQPNQLQALSLLLLHLRDYSNMIGLVFFSVHCALAGYLIYKSNYFPKVLGVLFVVAAVCYFTNSLSWFLAPGFADKVFPFILLPCLIAELSLSLWLLIKGVKQPDINEQPGY